ncbi:Rad52/Rad22 family DNA repair protein [Rhodococcus sp. RS1C4]|nr:Rad52/Rad22 family DNA repair protein [Rhodococcus sp. RS1C4]
MSNFTAAQTKQLLAPINPVRVLRDGKGNSHLPQQDVLAHLNRVFGFGSFDYEVLSLDLIFEQQHTKRDGKKPEGRYDVCYRATMRLTIRDANGNTVCKFEDGSTGDSANQTRADGHDLAMKSAISLAKKRCAIALGDQFGLSLYSKGSTNAIVGGTLVMPGEEIVEKDVQKDVPEAVSMGIDEIERETHKTDDAVAPEPKKTAVKPEASKSKSAADRFQSTLPTITAQDILDQIDKATTLEQLRGIWKSVDQFIPEAERPELHDILKGASASMKAEQENAA